MPVYQYRCKKCGAESQEIQRMGEPPAICKKCDIPMERKIGRTNFALRGRGWFKDGY